MGFKDKAKKLADQAQQKLDEAQEAFNQNASPEHAPDAASTRYDEHGRPIRDEPPAAATPPPAAEPAAPAGDTNQNPDPFKPLQQ